MSVSAAVASCFGNDPNSSVLFDPLFGGQSKAVQTCLHSNPVEFDGIKIRFIELFPHTQEFHSISVSDPVADEVISMIRVLVPGDICQANVVRIFLGK
ncbi:MAG: hypothetical protein PHF18_14395 [Methanosarcina sp.]|nr:hypothetical protein [Methanosarcina sp.]MDD3248018.1 hypothetical protein [Methanosarcina sp.]MDD4248091.1 hypothetical protein [Methanosarcina sp.]